MAGREKAIEHITKEIETSLNNIYTFRTRSAFTVWIGPFFLLGSALIATKGNIPFDVANTLVVKSAISILVIYLVFGIWAGVIEKSEWNRCEELRRIFLVLVSDESMNLHKDAFLNQNRSKMVVWNYIALFIVFGGVFLASAIVAGNIGSNDSAENFSTTQIISELKAYKCDK